MSKRKQTAVDEMRGAGGCREGKGVILGPPLSTNTFFLWCEFFY